MTELIPGSIEEAQRDLAALSRERKTVVFTGAGTKLGAPSADVLLRTRKLDGIVDYAPSDQVVSVEGGTTLAALQKELAKNGQRLALDPPFGAKATLGGIVAANSFGPLRARFGSVRDLIIGVSIVRADGTRAKGGGKVVKTVAGFDLPKLICGSSGTLGLIATATFRVHPVPEAGATMLARGLPAAGVLDLVRKMRAAQLEPVALLATRTAQGWDVAVKLEGFRAGVAQQRDKLRDLEEAPDSLWQDHLAALEAAPVRLKITALPSALPQVEAALAPLGARLWWYPTLGLGFAAAERVAADALGAARRALVGGSVTVECSAAPLEKWGPPPASLQLQRAVKARFDPDNLLAPGSFVGGI
jgi:glycolate oxidase FAD binding subunit